MTHREKRLFMIRELLSELPQCRDIKIPADTEGQKQLFKKSYEYPPSPSYKLRVS